MLKNAMKNNLFFLVNQNSINQANSKNNSIAL